jgi:hypothetical protein
MRIMKRSGNVIGGNNNGQHLKILMKMTFYFSLVYLATAVHEDVEPETWKLLKIVSAKRRNITPAKIRYNCSSLIDKMKDFGSNVTDCTINRGNLWFRIDDL